MDTAIDIHYIFRKLVSFFAADALMQTAVVSDMEEERFYDLADGHLWTRYPLQVMTSQLICYANGLWSNAGEEGFDYLSRDQCDEIRELAEAICCVYENDVNSTQDFWSISNLHTKKIWNSMRRVCRDYSGRVPGVQALSPDDQTTYIELLYL